MSIAERIASMSNNLSDAYDGIEYLGVDITGVDKNLQNLSSMLNVVYEGLPKVSDEGISPSIEGSRVGRLNTTLKASDTTQESTTGKNLFNKTDYTTISIGNNGHATSTETIDKITITTGAGSVSSGVYITKANLIDYINNYDSANTYYVSMDIKANRNITMQIGCDTRPSNIQVGTALSRISVETKIVNNGLIIYSTMNNEGDTIEVTNIMITTSSDTTYEPYTNGASPNPDYPQDIHVVKGNNTVFVGGKSLYDASMEETTTRGITRSADKERIYLNGTVASQGNVEFPINDTILPAGKYRLNLEIESGTVPNENGFNFYLYARTITGNTDKSPVVRLRPSPAQRGTLLDLSEPAQLYIHGYNQLVDFTITNIVLKYQVTLGETEDYDFVPYTPVTTYPINLPQGLELCKISTYQDKLFKAILGDTVYDSLTSEQKAGLTSGAWYKYAEIGKVVFNGSEDGWTLYAHSDTTDTSQIYIRTNDNKGYTTNTEELAISNYFKKGHWAVYWNRFNEVFVGGASGGYQHTIWFTPKSYTDIEDWKTWLSTHNTTVYYVLETPTITQITDTTLISQLEALYKAQSKNGQTNILQTNADNPFIIYASALKGE